MKKYVKCFIIIVLSAVGALSQNHARVMPNAKFAESLEAQISCIQKPKPLKAIQLLQRAGLLSKSPYNNVDSVSFFKVKKSLTVFGLKVDSVSGYDYYPKIFERGPGTSPGIWLGIVVPYSIEEVKERLKNVDFRKVNIDESTDLLGLQKNPRPRTEIACIGW